jgi:hypothetical protein
MGNCTIPDAAGSICGKQINEGEAIGTIVLGGPRVGHKRCCDAYHARVQEKEREKRLQMVKRIDQGGPGGPVDYTSERDAVMGSIPLETRPGGPAPADTGDPSLLGGLAAAAGVRSVGDLPMEVNPVEMMSEGEATPGAKVTAVQLPEGWTVTETTTLTPPGGIELTDEPQQMPGASDYMSSDIDIDQLHRDLANAQASTPAEELADKWYALHKGSSLTEFLPRVPSPLPAVAVDNGWVQLRGFELDAGGNLNLDPDDAEDLVNILQANIKRAWRQRQ